MAKVVDCETYRSAVARLKRLLNDYSGPEGSQPDHMGYPKLMEPPKGGSGQNYTRILSESSRHQNDQYFRQPGKFSVYLMTLKMGVFLIS